MSKVRKKDFSLIFLPSVFVAYVLSIAFGADLKSGKKVYTKYCVTCHGKSGKGDGPAGKALKPKPHNFTKGPFKYGCSPSQIANTIKKGVKGTAMVGFEKQLKGNGVSDVAEYILKTFVPKEITEKCIEEK